MAKGFCFEWVGVLPHLRLSRDVAGGYGDILSFPPNNGYFKLATMSQKAYLNAEKLDHYMC